MNRVKLTPRKKAITAATISVATAGILIACGVMVGFFGGVTSIKSQPTIGEFHSGYKPNPVEQEKYIGSLGKFGKLSTGAPDLFTESLPKEALIFKVFEAASQKKGLGPYKITNQEIGDCVSHGWARGIEGSMAVDYLNGRITDWMPVSPESVYAGRIDTGDASWSDGWYGSAAAKATKNQGVLFRTRYEVNGNALDLTNYSGNRAQQFGARGLPKWIYPERAKHRVREVALVTSVNELKAAHANGYFGPICSGQGFLPSRPPTQRDANGIATAGGTWWHCMCSCGYFTIENRGREETIFVVFNSWGDRSSTGPGGPHSIPTGAFGVRESVMAKILAARDSYVVSGPFGFERRDLDHETWAADIFSDRIRKESEFNFAVAP